MQGKHVLVTGGLGFIGSNLCHRLVDMDAKVTILDACLNPYGWNHTNIAEIKDRVRFVKGDIRDRTLMESLLPGQAVVYHMAAQVGREISMEDPDLDTDINCNGTLILAEICRRQGLKPTIIYAGSRGQIGEPVTIPVDEDHPTNPTDVYGINKLAAEKYLLLYGHVYDFPVVSLRFNNVYGPRCQMENGFYGILNWFIRRAMKDEVITVYGDGLQTRDYVYVDDVVDALIRVAVAENTAGEVFFVGSAVETVFLDMVKEVIHAVGKGEYKHIPFPETREKIDIRRFVVTYKKLNQYTGWAPKVDLREGMRRTVNFYRDRLDEYLNVHGH